MQIHVKGIQSYTDDPVFIMNVLNKHMYQKTKKKKGKKGADTVLSTETTQIQLNMKNGTWSNAKMLRNIQSREKKKSH